MESAQSRGREGTDHSPFNTQYSTCTILALFLVLAIAWTWPLGAYLSSRIAHDPGDPLLNTWILWWSTQAIPFTAEWWNAPFFHPMPGALALSEHLAGLAVIAAPLMLAGAHPTAAYNVTLILTYALSGFFSYLLVRRLTGSTLAAVLAGVAFAFTPYRAGQLAHIQVLASHWMPLIFLGLHAYLEEGRARWLALFAAAWLLQALSNGYYLLFLPVLIAAWLAWFPDWRRGARRGFVLAGTFAASSLLLVPVLLKYVEVHEALGLRRSASEMLDYSATVQSFFRPPHLLAFWPDMPDTAEGYLFPGVTTVAIVVLGVLIIFVRRRPPLARALRSPVAFYTIAATVMWLLALGPARPEAGWEAVFHPYSLVVHLPGYSGLRVPARFAMLACLCLSTAAGLVLARLAPVRTLRAAILAAAVVAGLVVDGWMESMPLVAPPGRLMLPRVPGLGVVELPSDIPAVGAAAMYRAIDHRLPLIAGYSGYVPPHVDAISDALHRDDPSVLPALARGRPIAIVIDGNFDPARDLRDLVERIPGVRTYGGTSGGMTYILPAQPRERVAPVGRAWDATVTLQPREHVVFDLGVERIVRALEFPVRDRFKDLGGRVAIEASTDATKWTTVWEDWTGGLCVAALLKDERLGLIRFPLPDVTARYLRVHPAPEWMWKEMRIYGPQ